MSRKPAIVVTDGFTVNPGDLSWEPLARQGELSVFERLTDEEVVERCATAEILLPNKARLTRSVLERLPRLRFICELATGYDNIDVAAAGEMGIPVANVPGYSTQSVAQHVLALLLELTNLVGVHAAAVRQGEWISSPDFCFCKGALTELAGKKVGIVGFGRIGNAVGRVLHALGMEVLAYSPRTFPVADYPLRPLSLDALAAEADVLSLHCPLTAENRGFVDAAFISRMKKGALLVNTARGALLNEQDIADALADGRLGGAAVDVVCGEPMSPSNPLRGATNCVITPHIAWATVEARGRLLETAARNVAAFLEGAPVNIVNAQHLARR